MSPSRINRRNFLLASAAVTGTCAIPVASMSLAHANSPRPMDATSPDGAAPLAVGSTLAEIEAALLALQPPILLLETAVPTDVTTDDGSALAISGAHAKMGDHSMQWDHTPGARLRIDGDLMYNESSFQPGVDQSLMGEVPMFSFWVYNEVPLKDSLHVEFGTGATGNCSFRFNLDFSGWRTCWVRYGYDTEGAPRSSMNRITVTAPARAGRLWFDLVVKNVSMRPDHATPDFQVKNVQPTVDQSDNYHWLGLNNFWGELSTPGFNDASVTEDEINDAKQVKSNLITRERTKKPLTESALDKLENELTQLGIPQLADNDASGAALVPAAPGSFVNGYQTAVLPSEFVPALTEAANIVPVRKVCDLILSAAQTWDTADTTGDTQAAARAETMFLRLSAHMHDQGWARGSAQGTIHHIGYQYRGWASSLLMTERLLRDRKVWEQTRDAIVWYCGAGRLTNDFSDITKHYSGLVDVLNTLIEGLLVSCLVPGPWEQRVARLRSFGHWINGAHRYTPGIVGGYKPDGFYFHHMGPYPAYGRDALRGSIPVVGDVTGTSFGLDASSAAILRRAMLTMDTVSNTSQWPISLSGRHPTGNEGIEGLVNSFGLLARNPLDGFDNGDGVDVEMASVFRRYVRESSSGFQKKLDAAFAEQGIDVAPAPQGYWQYGYTALGAHRQGEWLATVKGHNRYLWATEIYEADNLYGRYQTYGQIEVQSIANAENVVTHDANGWVQPGYDWNHIPGATTIVLPYEDLKADLTGTIQKIPLTESRFGGAGVLTGHATVFGMHLIEHPYFNPTHRARISALLVGDRVIALGSEVGNNDSSHPTHTTLFQMTPETMTAPNAVSIGNNWATDPAGNGYVVALGDLNARTRPQFGPHEDGTSEGTTRNYSLGWIDHGTAPQDSGYDYVILIGAGRDNTEAFVEAMAGEDKPYVVAQRDTAAHVVTDRVSGVTAHVVFEADTDLAADSGVRSATRPCLVLMHAEAGTVSLSITDPDLHLYEGEDEDQYDENGTYMGDFSSYSRPWKASPSPQTDLSVVLRGLWAVPIGTEEPRNGLVLTPEGGDTRVTVTTQHAASVEFELVHKGEPPTPTPTTEPSQSATQTPSTTQSPTATQSATATATATSTATASPTRTSKPTATNSPTGRPTSRPSPGLPNTGN